jgi:murein L,D-transpeptidase YcbB/YkuD
MPKTKSQNSSGLLGSGSRRLIGSNRIAAALVLIVAVAVFGVGYKQFGSAYTYVPNVSSCKGTVLSYGSTGACVKTVQNALNIIRSNNVYSFYGYTYSSHCSTLARASLAVDGQFGSRTQAMVKCFQSWKGISADGVVGPITWGKLGIYIN